MRIIAAAWIDRAGISSRRHGLIASGGELPELRDALLARFPGNWKFDNFRRGCRAVKMAQLAAVAAFADAEETIAADRLAVLGWNGAGCAAENEAYWEDYTTHGRESGRGSLFVPTLASAPMAEAAITLGARGGVCYRAEDAKATDFLKSLERKFDLEGPEYKLLLMEISASEATAVIFAAGGALPKIPDEIPTLYSYISHKTERE